MPAGAGSCTPADVMTLALEAQRIATTARLRVDDPGAGGSR